MITLTLNGQPCTCDKVQTLTELLRARAIAPDTVAVALNGTFVPKDRYDTTPLHDGDTIEILEPVWGG